MKTIYVTPAGKTATYHTREYFESALSAFGPVCGMIVLTSPDISDTLVYNLNRCKFSMPVEVICVDNPFSGMKDYWEVLSTMLEAVARMADRFQGEDLQCVVNCSGGTTKFTMWTMDLITLLHKLLPTRAFFATYDPGTCEVIFTERPMLTDKLIEKLFGEGACNEHEQERNRKDHKDGKDRKREQTESDQDRNQDVEPYIRPLIH